MKNKNRMLAREKAIALVSQMTLEEKCSQLTYDAKAIPRLGIRAYNWWNEALHGVARAGTATMYPQAIGLAAMFDPAFLQDIADRIATEGRAKYNSAQQEEDYDIYKGLTFWSPNVNIFRDPRWGRGHETYGEDPYLSGRLGVAFIKGIQGDGEYLKGVACAKHFAVHSGPEDERHSFNAEVSPKDLWETYLPAFYDCVVEADVESVMGAYNRTNGEPCCGSYALLRDILRDQWAFEGHVVSDCWAIKDFHMYHHVTSNAVESVALALKAGCDLNCGNMYLNLQIAYNEGKVTEEEITTACIRLFTTRYYLGIMDGSPFDDVPFEKIDCKEDRDKSLEAAEKSIVLLKNDGILPLDKTKVKSIAVIGPNANSRMALKGNYYGTASRYVTFLEGIQQAAENEGIRVCYSEGCDLNKDRCSNLAMANDRLQEAVATAKHCDVVVLSLGLDETLEGEEGDEGNEYRSGDKKDLLLPQSQQLLFEKIAALNKPTILLLTTGSAMDLNFAAEHCNGILQTFYPGPFGGTATARILFGEVSPSGKLPITFYADESELPDFKDYRMENRTYRNFSGKVQYPFGFGLTYGKVSIQDFQCTKKPTKENDFEVSVKIKNESNRPLREVVQIYIKDLGSPFAVKNFSLCGFTPVELAANETKEVVLPIKNNALTIVDETGRRYIDSNRFEIYAGISQPDSVSQSLTNTECKKIDFVVS